MPVLADIERNGFLIGCRGPARAQQRIGTGSRPDDGDHRRLAGGEFNINSPKQLSTVLFEKLGLKPMRKTKTGYSTDEDTLTQLATQHELPAQILNYRSLSKLKSTYVDALPEFVNPETKRLHTSLNQTVAATGRLSSTEPNLQNIPVKGEYGLRIREAFIAPRGHACSAPTIARSSRASWRICRKIRACSACLRREKTSTWPRRWRFSVCPRARSRETCGAWRRRSSSASSMASAPSVFRKYQACRRPRPRNISKRSSRNLPLCAS